KRLRQHPQHQPDRNRLRASCQLQQQAEDGDGVEPVSDLADDLCHPQLAKVAVAAHQAAVLKDGDRRRSHRRDSVAEWRLRSSAYAQELEKRLTTEARRSRRTTYRS